ncbi:MAG: endonuclease III, partial [Eubacterium sp.]|nr:endonuclease III [Eubacterium sp.]
MKKTELAEALIERLEKEYPLAECSLDYDTAWQLLVSVRLAAQCTDARVNIVTKDLFKLYPSAQALSEATVEEVTDIVRPCGLGPSKARDIVACMKVIVEKYDGKVPDNMKQLLELPGVG